MELSIFNQPLEWVQPKTMERGFELRAGGQTVAVLEFQSPFGSLAVAACGSERWTLKRVGFFRPHVTIRREGEPTDLAIYQPKWFSSEGVLEFSAGATYIWRTANFWATRYVLARPDGQVLISYQNGLDENQLKDLFKNQSRVEIDPAAGGLAELPLLVCMGWYLIILHAEDSAAATAAATAAT